MFYLLTLIKENDKIYGMYIRKKEGELDEKIYTKNVSRKYL